MRMSLHIIIALIMVLSLAGVSSAEQSKKMDLKVGDEVYACDCGIKCDCNTMANKAGNCTCGAPMVKAKVSKVEGDTAYLEADNWKEQRPFKTVGKYVCNCGPTCTCNAISQNPGKCPCGQEMIKAK